MRFAKPPVPTLRSHLLRMLLLSGAACGLTSSAIAGATYSYDALGRIISVRFDDGKQITYTYDAAGNRTQHVVSATTINRPPVAVGDAVTLTEDQPSITFNPRLNDSDPDGGALTLFSVGNGDYGTGALSGGSTTITYSSAYKRNATDKIVYAINDPQGMDAAGEVTIALVNLNPVAVNDAVSTVKNIFVYSFDPRTNDSDPGGDVFTITAKSTPAHGVLTITNGGTRLAYTPTANYTGPDSFTYTITDVDGGTATATVNVTVTHGASPPVAVNDSRNAVAGQATTFDPRTNDNDPDGGPITITAKTNGTHGTVTINGGTSVTYTSTAGYTGSDSFTYTIADQDNQTATATVAMTVTGSNNPPTAVNDFVNHSDVWPYGGPPITPSVSFNPTLNDTDPEGHSLSIIDYTEGTTGTLSLSGNNFTWTANDPYTEGSVGDSFTYTISDGNGGTATATVSISVTIGCVEGPGGVCP